MADDPETVTLALPRKALERLRVAWEVYSDDALRERSLELIRDVFDGGDGYLLAIDKAICKFDTDGDGNCAMVACPACHPEVWAR